MIAVLYLPSATLVTLRSEFYAFRSGLFRAPANSFRTTSTALITSPTATVCPPTATGCPTFFGFCKGGSIVEPLSTTSYLQSPSALLAWDWPILTSQTNPLFSLAAAPPARFTSRVACHTLFSLLPPLNLHTLVGDSCVYPPGLPTGCAMHRTGRPEDSPIAGYQLPFFMLYRPDFRRLPYSVVLPAFCSALPCPSMPTHRASTPGQKHAAEPVKPLLTYIV